MQNIQNTYSRSKQKKVLTINDQTRALCIYWKNKLLGECLIGPWCLLKKQACLSGCLATLALLVIIHCFKLSSSAIYRKTNAQNLRKWQNLILDPIFTCLTQIWVQFWPVMALIWFPKTFLWDLPLPDVMDCCKLSLYAISRETNETNLRKWQKKLVLGLLLVPLAQIWCPKFFS